MALVKTSGEVSNFREHTEVSSAKTYNTGHTQVNTRTHVNFRVGVRPVSMKDMGGMELNDGDQATVVGINKPGGIKGLVIQNDTTGIVYDPGMTKVLIWAIILIAVGIVTIAMFIGLILLPLGLYLLYKWWQLKQAYALLQT